MIGSGFGELSPIPDIASGSDTEEESFRSAKSRLTPTFGYEYNKDIRNSNPYHHESLNDAMYAMSEEMDIKHRIRAECPSNNIAKDVSHYQSSVQLSFVSRPVEYSFPPLYYCLLVQQSHML